jgi:hypothetical protein
MSSVLGRSSELRPLVYDLEIVKAIADRGEARLPDIQYVSGWGDHANMGISVLCAYDGVEKTYRIFLQDNLDDFAALARDRWPLVNFNGIRFDNHVLRACAGIDLLPENNYDISDEVGVALRLHRPGLQRKGYTLDNCANATLGLTKTEGMHGALAPILWQRGNMGKVIDYCLNDVRMTAQLFGHILKNGAIIDYQTGQPLKMRLPGEEPAPPDMVAALQGQQAREVRTFGR